VTLLTELDVFYMDHRRCGELDAGVDWPIVSIACECGASMARRRTRAAHLRSTLDLPTIAEWTVAAS
jgi:hypothetical protein